MSPIVVALTFVGLWLLVGLGLFFAAAGARGVFGLSAASPTPGEARVRAGVPTGHRFAWGALAVAGAAVAVASLAMIVASFVH